MTVILHIALNEDTTKTFYSHGLLVHVPVDEEDCQSRTDLEAPIQSPKHLRSYPHPLPSLTSFLGSSTELPQSVIPLSSRWGCQNSSDG